MNAVEETMSDPQSSFDLLRNNDLDGLRRLLEADATWAEAHDEHGVSLLMQALYRGRRDLAEFIASKKKSLDIFEAASLGRLDRLRDLLRDPGAVNTRSADGFTALHFACFFGQPESARLLIESGAAVDAVAGNPMAVMPLHSAVSARNFEATRLLLEHGAPPNARQQGGWVPLHSAAQNNDQPMVDLLRRHGADAKMTNDGGKTPAMVARESGHAELAAALES